MSYNTGASKAAGALALAVAVALSADAWTARLCAPARAEDAATAVDLRAPEAWREGECVTETETLETSVVASVAEGSAPPRELPAVTTSVESTVVRKCTSLGSDGRPSHLLLCVKSWRATGGGTEDRSLEGAILELRPVGWTIVRQAAEPSPRALAWLAADVVLPASWGETAAADIAPARRVEPGATWKSPKADAAARVLARMAVEADAKSLETTCTLKSASASAGVVTVRIEHAAATSAEAGGASAQVSGSLEGTPGAWHRTVTAAATAVLERTATAGDAKTTTRTTVRFTSKCVPGGEVPEGTPAQWLTDSGIAKAEKGDVAGAEADFTSAIQVDPLFVRAWCRRGAIRTGRRDAEGALEDFTRAIEIDPQLAEAWAGRAAAQWAAGDAAHAIEDYTSAIKLAPDDAKLWYRRGVAYGWLRQLDAAIDDYTKSIALDPAYAGAWNDRGNARDQKGDGAGALADFVKATELDPSFVAAWFNRGRAKLAIDDFDGAIADCTKAIELNPKYAAAWNTRGNSRSAIGDHEGAIADWTKTIEIDPRHPYAHFSIARTQFLPGLPAEPVIAALRKSIDLARESDYQHLWMWLARARLGEEAAATQELNEYVAQRKSSGPKDWYLVLAGLLTGSVLDDQALGESMTSDPTTSAQQLCEAAFYAGMVRIQRGDVAKAVELFDRAIATKIKTYIEYTEAHRWRPAILLGATTYAARPKAGTAGAGKPGALTIVSPDPRGAAALAGLAHGDVVTKMNGAPLKPGQLEQFLMTAAAGTKVRLEVLRKSKKITAEVVLGTLNKR